MTGNEQCGQYLRGTAFSYRKVQPLLLSHPILYVCHGMDLKLRCNRGHYTTGGVRKAKSGKVVQREEKIKPL